MTVGLRAVSVSLDCGHSQSVSITLKLVKESNWKRKRHWSHNPNSHWQESGVRQSISPSECVSEVRERERKIGAERSLKECGVRKRSRSQEIEGGGDELWSEE